MHSLYSKSVLVSHSVLSDFFWPHGLKHARLPCPSPIRGVYSNSCPLSQWCHPTSHPLSSPFPLTFNLSQHQGLFKWVSSSHQEAKVFELCLSFLHTIFLFLVIPTFLLWFALWIKLFSRALNFFLTLKYSRGVIFVVVS